MTTNSRKLGGEATHDHYITPEQLQIGLYVHLDLGWMDHPFTFSNFKIKDKEQISKIRGLNLKKIRYDPKRSDVAPKPVKPIVADRIKPAEQPAAATPTINPQQRAARLKQLNEAIVEGEQAFSKSAVSVREAVRNLADHPEHAKKVAENLVGDMVNSVITESNVVLHAISSNSRGHENFVHPLNVTVLALMLAKSLDMKEEETSMLGVASMFHDVGKEETPKNKSFIDLHCEVGARIALRSGFSERISRIIMQHHEYMDGSGFPKHHTGDMIDPLARILALVNHYDNLCNPPNPADAMTPYEALSKMYVSQSQKFDASMLQLLVKSLGVYPPGSIVQLSNGAYGVVLTTNPYKSLQPLVMVYIPEVARETPVVLDLGEENHLSIKKCLRPAQLPKEAFDYLSPRKRVSYYFLKKEDTHGVPTTPASQADVGQTDPVPSQRRA